MSLETRLHMMIASTNQAYKDRGVADIYSPRDREPDEDFDIDYLGAVISSDGTLGMPLALSIVATQRPQDAIEIVDEDAGPGQVSYATLEELAGYISFSGGRAGLLWSNAGHVVVLGGQALVSAARRFATNLDRMSNGGPSKLDSVRIRWEQFKVVPSTKIEPYGLVYDWLKASRDDWDATVGSPPSPPPVPTIPPG